MSTGDHVGWIVLATAVPADAEGNPDTTADTPAVYSAMSRVFGTREAALTDLSSKTIGVLKSVSMFREVINASEGCPWVCVEVVDIAEMSDDFEIRAVPGTRYPVIKIPVSHSAKRSTIQWAKATNMEGGAVTSVLSASGDAPKKKEVKTLDCVKADEPPVLFPDSDGVTVCCERRVGLMRKSFSSLSDLLGVLPEIWTNSVPPELKESADQIDFHQVAHDELEDSWKLWISPSGRGNIYSGYEEDGEKVGVGDGLFVSVQVVTDDPVDGWDLFTGVSRAQRLVKPRRNMAIDYLRVSQRRTKDGEEPSIQVYVSKGDDLGWSVG